MSKWLQVFLMFLGSAVTIAYTTYAFNAEAAYTKTGQTARINPAFEITLEPGKDGKTSQLAHMSYVDLHGRPVKFKRYLNAEILARLERKEAVSIQYLPDEWNTERFAGEDRRLSVYVLACLAFLAALVYAIRKPAPDADKLEESSPIGKLIIRTKLGVMAVAGLLAGVGGLVQGSAGHGMTDGIMLAVGIVFAGLFALSLKLR